MIRRLRIGRLSLYIEPRDIWIGVYIATNAVYVCPLPLVVLKWARTPQAVVSAGDPVLASGHPDTPEQPPAVRTAPPAPGPAITPRHRNEGTP